MILCCGCKIQLEGDSFQRLHCIIKIAALLIFLAAGSGQLYDIHIKADHFIEHTGAVRLPDHVR